MISMRLPIYNKHRTMRLIRHTIAALALVFIAVRGGAADLPLDEIKLPPGFHIEIYARAVGARSLALSPSGVLFVGSRDEGKVYAVLPNKDRTRAARVLVIARDLQMPNGVALKNDSLYVAEISRILRFDSIEKRLEHPPKPVVWRNDYPKDVAHGWKFIRFGPDGWLYVPIGAPCNICEPPAPYASITRVSPDGKRREIYARGVRNTVGFDWDPRTKELWFTDNGRDWLGDDSPPDELNHAKRTGLHFGYPYCHGGTIPDPKYGAKRPCSDFVPPAQNLGPHVASLGMRFYTGNEFPDEYRGRIFIAEHGSWNRSTPIGYRITQVTFKDGNTVDYAPFAEGWLQNGQPWGRPVDVEIMPDGSMLVSDDYSGTIYRISYAAPAGAPNPPAPAGSKSAKPSP